jgi:hypothetical protein
MAFPSNPSNGDTYIRYGRTYEYEAALSMWKVKQSGIQLNELSDVDVDTTTPSVGDTLVWSGTKFVPDEINLLSVYQSELPLAGNVAGQMAYVTDTSRLYIYTGAGWFNVALINTNPTITVGPDGRYAFATDGTPIVLTLEAQDPEEVPIAWSYVVTSGVLGSTATVHQEGNVFTITPSTDENDAGEFSITFTASDGVNLATAVSSFTLAFGTADQYYNNNSLLLKSGSTAGLNNTSFVDESTNGFTVTPTGDVHQGSYSPYSPAGWSVFFSSAAGQSRAIRTPATLNNSSGTGGDFTLEAWAMKMGNSSLMVIAMISTSLTAFCRLSSNGSAVGLASWTTAQANHNTFAPIGTWFHVAACRHNGTLYTYINGVMVNSVANSTNYVFNGGSGTTLSQIGNYNNNTNQEWLGYISNYRIVNGTALYPSGTSFVPSTEPLTAVPNTILLACQSNRIIDNSTYSSILEPVGTIKPSVYAQSPYLPQVKYDPTVHGGSAYFDGTGDYLLVPTSSDLQPQSADFTAECWVKCTATAGSYTGVMAMNNINTGRSWRIWFSGENAIHCDLNSQAGTMIATGNFIGQWIHVAYVKQGSTNTFYINGTARATYTTTTVTSTSDPLIIGAENDAASPRFLLTGYISNVRIAKAAIYTSDFTPPTEPLTAVSGTSLLLNMNNAGIYDEISKNNFRIVGNTTTSTTQTKYSDTAMYFDGAGDYLSIPAGQNINLGTGDFTIEGWIYPIAVGTGSYQYPVLFSLGGSDGGSPGHFSMYINHPAGQNMFYYHGVSYINGGTNPVTGAWSHVALTRTAGTMKYFINGVQQWTSSVTAAIGNSTDTFTIGIRTGNTGQCAFYGYMQDFRITKGVGRYTANFTPPIAALGFDNAE